MLAEVLNLDGRVVSDQWKFGVKRLDNGDRVLWAVEEIRITEGHVSRARDDLLTDVFDHNLSPDDTKSPVVDGRDGTMPADVLAASAGFGVGDQFRIAILA